VTVKIEPKRNANRSTFSLLPDCLSARLVGSLDEVEEAVVVAESMGVEGAAQALRVEEIELPGALRWLRRRRRGVRAALLALMTAAPGRLGTVPEVRAEDHVEVMKVWSWAPSGRSWPYARSGAITCTSFLTRSDSPSRARGG
jgi:hypothetical protein